VILEIRVRVVPAGLFLFFLILVKTMAGVGGGVVSPRVSSGYAGMLYGGCDCDGSGGGGGGGNGSGIEDSDILRYQQSMALDV